MKNNKKSVMLIIALMLVVLGGYFVAGTYAKYTSEISGTSNASIAGWKWTIGNEDLKNIIDTKESKYSLSLFDTIYEEDTKTSEEHVSANNIAPGTGGSFTISIANKSQVDTTYKYDLSIENNLNAKLQFKVGENDAVELAKDATYTVKFAKDAVADTNTTANKSEAFTVSFKRGVDGVATTSDKPAVKTVTATDSNTITVEFDKEVDGATATKVENYAIAGLTIDSAILKNVDGKATTVVLTLAKGTNKLNGARDLTVTNVAAKNGAVMETATVTVKDMLENVAPTVQTAKFSDTANGKVSEITLTSSSVKS